MRIAFLSKRRYMRQDVIEDRYGRLYELPAELARLGHEVLGICLSYRAATEGCFEHECMPGRLTWKAHNAGRALLPGILRHPRRLRELLAEFRPHLILGASDALHIVLARKMARRLRVPYAADLYDNFESFGMTRVPPLGLLYRRAVSEASVVLCVSSRLAEKVRKAYGAKGAVATLESTISDGDFTPLDRTQCREALGLPPKGRFIGTVGALDASRGVDVLYRAYRSISTHDDNVHLVLAGTGGSELSLPSGPQVHYLGQLPHSRIPLVYGALDVGVICVRDTAFGRFSFPQKAYEMAAMRIPLVVADVGAMGDLFARYPACLYRPDSEGDIERKLRQQLENPEVPLVPIPTWAQQGKRLEKLLVEAAGISV